MAVKRMIRTYSYCLNRHCLLVGWITLNLIVFLVSYYHYFTHLEYFYLRKILGHGLSISRGSAAVLNLSCALVLLPVCRRLNSTLHKILGRYARYFLTCWFTNLKAIHITIAITIVVSSVVHSGGHVINAINFSNNFNKSYTEINWALYKGQSPALLILTSVVGVTGVLMLFLLLLMVLLSTSYIRQFDYDLFWGSHFLFIVFLILYFIHPLNGVLTRQTNTVDHIPGCRMKLINNSVDGKSINDYFENQLHVNFIQYGYKYPDVKKTDNFCISAPIFGYMRSKSWMFIAIPLALYLIDIALRVRSRNCDGTFTIKSAMLLPGDVIDLKIRSVSLQNISSSSSILNHNTPSQYVLLQCPKISPLEWHPFTVVNSFKDKLGHLNINLLIKVRGDWTRSIYNSSVNLNLHSQNQLRLLVDGPFFSPIQNIVNSTIVICIAAGIGITPFAALLHHIVKEDIKKMCPPFKVHLVWVIRTIDQLTWIQDSLIKINKKLSIQNHLQRFDFKLFITKDCNPEQIQEPIQRILEMKNVCIYYGRRPDWLKLLSGWQQYYERGTVKVFLSGPPTLISEIGNLCHKLNKNNNSCYLKCIIESFC